MSPGFHFHKTNINLSKKKRRFLTLCTKQYIVKEEGIGNKYEGGNGNEGFSINVNSSIEKEILKVYFKIVLL